MWTKELPNSWQWSIDLRKGHWGFQSGFGQFAGLKYGSGMGRNMGVGSITGDLPMTPLVGMATQTDTNTNMTNKVTETEGGGGLLGLIWWSA